MKQLSNIKHEFVEFIPKEREEGVLYISIPYSTAVHSCPCGCSLKVVTPLSPVGWKLTFDGETVTLFPSIGSWSFPCRSHYFIRRNIVVWSEDMSQDEIEWWRAPERKNRERHLELRAADSTETDKKKWSHFRDWLWRR
jgi:hypothetical protein